jgi:hypothetical protein
LTMADETEEQNPSRKPIWLSRPSSVIIRTYVGRNFDLFGIKFDIRYA